MKKEIEQMTKVANKETNVLDATILKQIEKELLDRKQQIVDSLTDLSRPDNHEADSLSAKFPKYGDKPDENAQEINDYTTNLAAEKILEKTLEDIESALKRIKKGEYGICKYCQQKIDKKRLLARPVASSCITCKTELQENE